MKRRLIELEPTLPKRLRQTAAFALGAASGVADARFEIVDSDFGGFRLLAATFCLAMTLAVAVPERRAGDSLSPRAG